MKKTAVLAIVLVVLAVGPAFAQKVYVDYDKDYDFDNVKTFSWVKTETTSMEGADPLMHSRIVNAIEHYISMGGVRETDSNPDVHVTYHTSTKENVSFNTDHWGYGYPRGWYGGYYGRYGYGAGFSTSTTTVSTYNTGTLIVDVWDAKSKELIWRGIATNITVSTNPAKMEKRIDKALKKIVSKSQKLRAKD
jgi:hypothetical protein